MKIITLLFYLCFLPDSFAVEQLEVQGLFSGKAVVLIDGTRHILSVGEASEEGVKLVSANSHFAILEVDGKQNEYKMGSSVSLNYAQPTIVKEQIMANEYGMFLSYGSINGHSVKFLVDTGATSIAMSSDHAKRIGLLFRLQGKESRATTASGVVKAWLIKLKSVKLGRIKQKNIEALVLEGSHPTNVLLGMSFMDKLKVSKDGSKLVLEQKK